MSTPIDGASSSEAENPSKNYDQFLKLGELIVEELEIQQNDLLGRWMAHYVAELIEECKLTQAENQKALKQQCCSEILELWKHHRFYKRPPLKTLDSIFELLKLIDDRQSRINFSYFYAEPKLLLTAEGESLFWLTQAQQLDEAVRVVIKWCLSQASENSSSREKAFLEIGSELSHDNDDDDDQEFIAYKTLSHNLRIYQDYESSLETERKEALDTLIYVSQQLLSKSGSPKSSLKTRTAKSTRKEDTGKKRKRSSAQSTKSSKT